MSARTFLALGTGSQVPTRQRNHNGYFLRWDERGFLFDPGEGTQRQMAYYGLAASQISKIFVTHFHGDHCLGLAGIIQRLSLDRVEHAVEIYYPASGQRYLDHLKDAAIFFNAARIEERPIAAPGVIFADERITIETQPLDHTVECWGYRLREHDSVSLRPEALAAVGLRGPAVAQLKRDGQAIAGGRTVTLDEVSVVKPGQAFAFVMDTRVCDAAVALAHRADLAVCEATYLSSEAAEAHAHGHLTAADAARIAHEAGVRRLVLTHFSQRYASLEPFVAEAKAVHGDVVAVNDGDVVDVPRRVTVEPTP
jgi:ribonuclease Z